MLSYVFSVLFGFVNTLAKWLAWKTSIVISFTLKGFPYKDQT